MMRSSRSRWISGIGAVVLSGGLLVAGYGTGVPLAEATITLVNPFPIIIDKLNEILAKLSTSGGGGNHTLRWDTNNPSATRFTTAFPGAVLDNNTGLVWEQAPDGAPRNWATVGWRLPSMVELISVQDGSPAPVAPFVPGTVFTGVQLIGYWSATTFAGGPTDAWVVFFSSSSGLDHRSKAIDGFYAWCVRGGMNADTY